MLGNLLLQSLIFTVGTASKARRYATTTTAKTTSTTVAPPACTSAAPPAYGGCVVPTQDEANLLIKRWTTTLTQTNSDFGTPEQTWEALLTDDFQLVSGSIQTLQRENLNGNYVIYGDKATYIANELQYGALYTGVHDLDIVAGCGRVVWYWQVDSVLAGLIKVRGVNIFTLTDSGLVSQLVVENDSLAFAVNFGANVTFPDGSTLP